MSDYNLSVNIEKLIHLSNSVNKLTAQTIELQAKLDKAVEALKYYRNADNWYDSNERTEPNIRTSISDDDEVIGRDDWGDDILLGGKRAREILKEIGVEG
jgi:hypothetical protein